MSRLSKRAGKNRLAIAAGLIAAIAASWFLLRGPGVELISEEIVGANVVEVIGGSAGTSATIDDAKGVGIVLVELPDGGRARIFVPLSKVSVGTAVQLKVKRYSDGSRQVTAAVDSEEN